MSIFSIAQSVSQPCSEPGLTCDDSCGGKWCPILVGADSSHSTPGQHGEPYWFVDTVAACKSSLLTCVRQRTLTGRTRLEAGGSDLWTPSARSKPLLMVTTTESHTCEPVRPLKLQSGRRKVGGTMLTVVRSPESADGPQTNNRRSSYFGGTFIPRLVGRSRVGQISHIPLGSGAKDAPETRILSNTTVVYGTST